MIEFVLNSRSRVNTYVQLIQQVKQALRVGLLTPGDQLPKVRDVAQSLAINPNTVLKAYRELEIEGLVEGRPGVGTFVRRSLADAPLANQVELREELVAWVQRARAAGLAPEDVTALVETTMRAALAAEASRDETARAE
ncbi:GntR family transcriptional regulator [Micromonospora coxensis]|uniref:Transcriptional regulator, GntR family n=1 Tax=Micromonospora coxensis TaxID=356852 RepID=A0A1C5J936_9ACTN|nr:GntR family transcriptional regulator [Micromonospora coxensis]SCG67058.1 transcriptional regulator, GntR family [Micromonospora coxensis]